MRSLSLHYGTIQIASVAGESRRVTVSGLAKARLLWLFRNFSILEFRVLSKAQQQLIYEMWNSGKRIPSKVAPRDVIGTVEAFSLEPISAELSAEPAPAKQDQVARAPCRRYVRPSERHFRPSFAARCGPGETRPSPHCRFESPPRPAYASYCGPACEVSPFGERSACCWWEPQCILGPGIFRRSTRARRHRLLLSRRKSSARVPHRPVPCRPSPSHCNPCVLVLRLLRRSEAPQLEFPPKPPCPSLPCRGREVTSPGRCAGVGCCDFPHGFARRAESRACCRRA